MDRFIVINRPTTTELRDKSVFLSIQVMCIDETENDTSSPM